MQKFGQQTDSISVFYLEVLFAIIGIVALYLSFSKIKSYPQHRNSSLVRQGTSKIPRVDIEGWLLLILAVTVPLIAFTIGNNLLEWQSPIEISLLTLGPIFMVLFVFFEAKIAKDPVIDMTPVFHLQYLRVLFQVFAVVSIFNAVWLKSPGKVSLLIEM